MISGIGTRLAQLVDKVTPPIRGLALLAVLILILAVGGESARLTFQYDRSGLASYEIWRLAGGHLVHLGWNHTLMNLSALALIIWLFGALFGLTAWLVIALASGLMVDAGLWWLSPGIQWYVGLSGVLHGLVAAAGIVLSAQRQLAGYLVLTVLVTKIAWEQADGSLPMTEFLAGGSVVVDAHLYGAVGGLLAGLTLYLLKRNLRD
jgi:rhomboid family GlyGly-CTERM serine protease